MESKNSGVTLFEIHKCAPIHKDLAGDKENPWREENLGQPAHLNART